METTTEAQEPEAQPEAPAQEETLPGLDAPAEPGNEEAAPATIHECMAAILAELPAIGKDTRNPQQDFMYRSHDDVLNALNPLLAKYGVYVVPDVVERERIDTRRTGNNKVMYEVNLHVRFTFVARDGSWIAASAWGEGTDMGDKSTNKAMTMAFKNVLAVAFAVSTQEGETYDTDGASPEETGHSGDAEPRREPTQAERAANRRGKIEKLAGELDAKSEAEPGTWMTLVRDGATAAFGQPYEELPSDSLDEIGKTLVGRLGVEKLEIPEQVDFTVPF